MRQYIALIHKDADGDFGVSFPDLPGCVTAGSTLDEARDMAAEALAFHLEGLQADGEAVPEPSSLEAVISDPINKDGVAILVAAPAAPVASGAKRSSNGSRRPRASSKMTQSRFRRGPLPCDAANW
jgi:predicted RNase H-like HicB family nuclease